jgi:F0F1-type ATP synthase assembly protein I
MWRVDMAETPQDQQRSEDSAKSDDDQSQLAAWYRLTGVGIEFIVAVLLLGGVGWWIDSKLQTRPWLTLVGLGLGFALGLYIMIRAARQLFRD